jgi:hypothetical protein
MLDVSFLRAVGFFCNLHVLLGGLGVNKLQFLGKRTTTFEFFQLYYFTNFSHKIPGSGSTWTKSAGSRSALLKPMRIHNNGRKPTGFLNTVETTCFYVNERI